MVINLVDTLNEKEKEIYRLLCENKSNAEIADEVRLCASTVKYHLQAIYKKLGLQSSGKDDLHLCRQRAICYSGTRIEQTVSLDKSIGYSKEEMISAAKRLTWYDSSRVHEILDDLFAVLDKTAN